MIIWVGPRPHTPRPRTRPGRLLRARLERLAAEVDAATDVFPTDIDLDPTPEWLQQLRDQKDKP